MRFSTPRRTAFDHIAAMAANIFHVPIAVVSLVDEDRIWFESHVGIDVPQVGRDPGLCATAMLSRGFTTCATLPRRARTTPFVRRRSRHPLLCGCSAPQPRRLQSRHRVGARPQSARARIGRVGNALHHGGGGDGSDGVAVVRGEGRPGWSGPSERSASNCVRPTSGWPKARSDTAIFLTRHLSPTSIRPSIRAFFGPIARR